MSDDLARLAREWSEDGPPQEPFYATGHLIDAMADRIEELEAKLAQQDDLVQAAVAAALREAANTARASLDGEIAYDDILALITPDAQAALDCVVAAERERCAQVAEDWNEYANPAKSSLIKDCEIRNRLASNIAAAIRKGGE